jgi:mitogen-activated protein kinase kinase kinase 9
VLNRELRPTIPPKCPEGFTKLMKKCWESEPAKRPGFREIIRELEIMKLT